MEELEPLDINGNIKKWYAIKNKEFKNNSIEGLSKHNSDLAIKQLKELGEYCQKN